MVLPCAYVHADELRSFLSDLAASLRAVLKELVTVAVAPIIAASSVVQDWIERARNISSRAEALGDTTLPASGARLPCLRSDDFLPVVETTH